MKKAQAIYGALLDKGILTKEGEITMSFLGTEVKLQDKSAVGNILEEWLGNWMKNNDIFFIPNENSQMPPDFYLSEDRQKDLLEIKAFDSTSSPNFDVANFDTYIRSLLIDPSKIDSDYLIFGYKMSEGKIYVKKMWLKKVWQITCPSAEYPIRTQNKQDKIVNIRPATWYSEKATYKTFESRKKFLDALEGTIKKYEHLSLQIEPDTWRQTVEAAYTKMFGRDVNSSDEEQPSLQQE